ncbi:hypothetical protein [Microbacterium gubbeenense]|uniref:hypothetical protein n=1 Tax=Microbacterium gubbeenense TaxID=159896 RepID=UPI003F98D313
MSPKKLPSPYRPEGEYALRATPRLDQLARYFQNAADAHQAAADAANRSPSTGEDADDARTRIRAVLRNLNIAAEHAEIARRLAIEVALEGALLSQQETADELGTSKKAVYDRRHRPVTLTELAALPPIEVTPSSSA